jgi:hypothetical protein
MHSKVSVVYEIMYIPKHVLSIVMNDFPIIFSYKNQGYYMYSVCVLSVKRRKKKVGRLVTENCMIDQTFYTPDCVERIQWRNTQTKKKKNHVFVLLYMVCINFLLEVSLSGTLSLSDRFGYV